MLVRVSLLDNDGWNGNFTGQVSAIDIDDEHGEELLSLIDMRMYGRLTKVSIPDYNHIRIGRLKFHHHGTAYIGNWCWDMYLLTDDDAIRLLNYLRKSGNWEVDQGICEFVDKWQKHEDFTKEDFKELDK